jgi:murein DD-endopeptidase MepM/ murein hydrolase activator NlpD
MSSLRAGSIALVVAAGVALAVAVPARAQEPADPSSTTTSSTSSTVPTVPGVSPTDPTATSTSTTAPPAEDPAANGDAPPETVPAVEITVPPRPPEAYGSQPSLESYPGRVVRVSSRTARARATETQAVVDAAIARRDLLALRRLQLREATAHLAVDERAAIAALEEAQIAFEERAADAYIRGNLGGPRELILSEDATEYVARLELLEVVVEADERAVRIFREAREAVDDEQLRTATELATVARELLAASDAVVSAELEHELASRELAVFLNGGSLVIHGFAFPVGVPHQFGDSFGAPRMVGTPFEHWHEGTDIFAPMGTPLPACERGVVMRIGTGGVLGGNTVWLRGESGVAYYYAHLSDFAPSLREGMVVDPGTVLGFVGDTGNARGTSPHLHFEVHPGGGAAINPYPILRVAEEQVQPELIWLE